MLEKIINSKTRLAILFLFFQNQDKEFYPQQIIKAARLDPANTHKELDNLREGSFLLVRKKGNRRFFKLNKANDFYRGLDMLLAEYKKKNKQEQWISLESMPDYYPMMVACAWNLKRANDFFQSRGFKNRYSKLLTTYENNVNDLLVVKNEFEALSHEVLEKCLDNPEWGNSYVSDLMAMGEELNQATSELNKINLAKLSNTELFKVYDRYYETYSRLHVFHWVQTVADFGDNIFSKYLMSYLKKKVTGHKYSLGEVFSVMTTPTIESNPSLEYQALLRILQYILSKPKLKNYFKNTETRLIVKDLKKLDSQLDTKLENHVKDFGYLGYGVAGPGWSKDYFVDILASLIRQKAQPDKLLKEIKEDRQKTAKKQIEFVKIFNIDQTHQGLFEVARGIVYTKGSRKETMFYSYSVIENLFKEIGRRFYLSVGQVRYLYPHEFKPLLLEGKFSAALLNERYKFSLQYSLGDYFQDKLLEGDKARKFLAGLNIIRQDIKDVKIFEGDCASPGRAQGEVKIINVVSDMKKMEAGNILVSIATNPDLVPAIKKAAAIVTDIGGITCHAAIVSRELGIPCVIGTKIATKVLKDGDIVSVDATHGKINIVT